MSKQVVVASLPKCDFCDERARYDSQVRVFGGTTWAYSCEYHWEAKRASTKLGAGFGQRLVLAFEGERVRDNEALPRMKFR